MNWDEYLEQQLFVDGWIESCTGLEGQTLNIVDEEEQELGMIMNSLIYGS